MKISQNIRRSVRGLTLLELTFTLFVVLTLVAILFAGTSAYASHAGKASCVITQRQLRMALIADANLTNRSFEPGVDYYAVASARGLIAQSLTCPDGGGGYSAKLDATGQHLIITCHDHEGDHR
jgi:hypothetical protein